MIVRHSERPLSAGDHWIPMDGGTVYARAWVPTRRHESNAAILLFHDSLGSVELWRDFPELLADATRYPVVAYDRLGFGRSDAFRGALPFTFIHDEALTAARVMDVLGLETVIPFGHSVGGGMAIATAARWPERCLAVVTEAAQSFVEDRTLAGLHAARAAFAEPGQVERLARYHGEKASWVLEAWLGTWLHPAFADWCLDDELRGVRCPVLALHGDQDEYGSGAHPDRIARLTQGPSRAAILDGCGHIPHREQPARLLDEVVRFLPPHGT